MRSMVEGGVPRGTTCVEAPLRQGFALPPPRAGEDEIPLSYSEPIWFLLSLQRGEGIMGQGDEVLVDALIAQVIAREGDYSDHPADRGGATRFGITEAVARADGYTGPMRRLPLARAEAIYRRLYWTAPGFDRVAAHAPRLAEELFDTGVNMGPNIATAFLQRALNALNRGARDYPDLTADGRIGAATLAALDAFLRHRGAAGEVVLLKAVEALQGERYLTLAERRPANEAFLYGWLADRLS